MNRLVPESKTQDDEASTQAAYELAHQSFLAACKAQSELGWQEGDELGRFVLQGQAHSTGLYSHDAWCLWQLNRLEEAAVALEAGRAQALAEAQLILAVSLVGICPEHQQIFSQARQTLQDMRQRNERTSLREARDEFLRARKMIREHCHSSFLPDEPTYQDIFASTSPKQALVYLAATIHGGIALVVPSAQGSVLPERPHPSIIPLPDLTHETVKKWLVRSIEGKRVVGGLRIALGHLGIQLLMSWIQHDERLAQQEIKLDLPLYRVPKAIPEEMDTLRQALNQVVESWREEASWLSGGTSHQQEVASLIRAQLALPLGTVLEQGLLPTLIDWFLQQAELERLLPELSAIIMRPLRQGLNELGFCDSNQQIALIACGLLGVLPLHAAMVLDPFTGEEVPFQETCELTYQASASSLAVSRALATAHPQAGTLLSIGDPQPTTAPKLPWAEAEAEAVAHLAEQMHRLSGPAILGEEATLMRIKAELSRIREQQAGSWVEFASHGYTDPEDPRNCYLLLANDQRLTLADLQRERMLEQVRCFTASGCVTGLGDIDTAPDELSSFAAGVLQAGSACAIATLWSVSDRATFLLMLRFHQLILGDSNLTPAHALREAAKWLRQVTSYELDDLARTGLVGIRPIPAEKTDLARDTLRGVSEQEGIISLLEELPESFRFSAEKALGKFRLVDLAERANECPYAHPIYWASAVVYGA